ncbi:MAG: hypothetical protein M1828_003369 [Chrysothrix sp. TS-e1954]|nr:MAG: hypothetical protein M1828_003369 [Chrysothrix sp. TS-e1954]
MISYSSSNIVQRVVTTPALRALLAFSIVFLALYQYGRTHFYRDPGSIFFSPSYGYERKYSVQREAEAHDFLAEVEADEKATTKQASDPLVCASFVTVGREGVTTPYIYQAISSALANMTSSEREQLHLAVLFADADPHSNSEMNSTLLKSLVDTVYSTADVAPSDLQLHIAQLALQHETDEKGTLDYTVALQYCLEKTNAPWLAVFEDDILFADGWLARTVHGLRTVERTVHETHTPEVSQKPPGETRGWLLLRLFNQERSTGWVSRAVGGNHELPISLGIAAGALPLLILLRRKGHYTLRTHLDNPTLALIIILFIPVLVVLFFQAGKASMLPPTPGVRPEDFGCCSQALVFNRAEASGLIDYLRAQGRGRCDLMTTMYARETGIKRWSQYPMMVQHVGSHSATGTSEIEAQAVWSMAFEDLQAESVASEHRTFVEEEYVTEMRPREVGSRGI